MWTKRRRVSGPRQDRPELVVTDIVMPDREGLETIRELRRLAPHLPVIAISGSDPGANCVADAISSVRSACSSMLRKPFRPAALIAEIERLLPHVPGETLTVGDGQ